MSQPTALPTDTAVDTTSSKANVDYLKVLGALAIMAAAAAFPFVIDDTSTIRMVSLGLILAIAAFRRDTAIKLYLIPLSAIGGLIAAYHYYIERFPAAGGSCNPLVPCNTPWFEQWGFVTLAFMALMGFLDDFIKVRKAHNRGIFWKRSSSDTRRARSPTHGRPRRAWWRKPTGARCSWTRSAPCLWISRRSS